MTAEQFLLDTLEYYTKDISRRSYVRGVGKCVYVSSSFSEGCAIGRHLLGTPEEKTKWDNTGGYCDCIQAITDYRKLIDLRPEWMKKLNIHFLRGVQNLHDLCSYWDDSGLTEDGRITLRRIISDYKLNNDLFKKYL